MEENERYRSDLDRRFLKHIREKKDAAKIIAVLALGAVLIFLGGRLGENDASTVTGIEERIGSACSSIEGVGECTVYVYYAPSNTRTEDAVVESVIVICEGADSVDVRLRLTKMLSSYFGIGANRVRVEKMKE